MRVGCPYSCIELDLKTAEVLRHTIRQPIRSLQLNRVVGKGTGRLS